MELDSNDLSDNTTSDRSNEMNKINTNIFFFFFLWLDPRVKHRNLLQSYIYLLHLLSLVFILSVTNLRRLQWYSCFLLLHFPVLVVHPVKFFTLTDLNSDRVPHLYSLRTCVPMLRNQIYW